MEKCFVCNADLANCGPDTSTYRRVGSKARTTLSKFTLPKAYEEDEDLYVHHNCYKTFTAHGDTANKEGSVVRTKSVSRKKPYDYLTHCLICAREIDVESAKRHPERKNDYSSIQYVNGQKKCIIQETLMRKCEERKDSLAVNVKGRIEFAGDLRAVDAQYHRSCMQAFLAKKNIPQSSDTERNIRNLNNENDEAFQKLCLFLDKSDQSQFGLADLRTQLAQDLPDGVPAYSLHHLK